MIGLNQLRRATPVVDRSRDRVVVVLAVALAVGFMLAAVASAVLPVEVRRGIWLPLHLALAGGATTAIAGVMPFFVAAFAAAPPTDFRLRVAAVLSVALGATAVSLGVVAGWAAVAAGGGALFIAGIGLVALAALRPLRAALGPSRGIIVQGYVVALLEVGIGAALATLYVAAWLPLVAVWGSVKPAHAWLNLVGFTSLIIATTLLHFFPTVIGARMAARPSARITVMALAAGPLMVAAGFAAQLDLLGRVGGVVVIAGMLALVRYVAQTWVTRGRWTTDAPWHLFAIGGLISAIAWFAVGILIAAGRVVVGGTAPDSWSIDAIFGPLVVGWIGLAIVASATHLLPAVGPGDPEAHRRQRSILGRGSLARLVIFNAGVAALSIGLVVHSNPLVAVGAILVAIGLFWTGFLLAAALRVGMAHATIR